MAGNITEPRDLSSNPEPGHASVHGAEHSPGSGRWEREAEQPHRSGPEDSATRTSRIFFFVILAVIAASFVFFLVLHPE